MAIIEFPVDYSSIPERMRDGARLYAERGVRPGSFLTAVLTNDLVGAYRCADQINAAAMRAWVSWMYNELPMGAWGSHEKVDAWCESGGGLGLNEQDPMPDSDPISDLSDRAAEAVKFESDAMASWESRRPTGAELAKAAQTALDSFVDSIDSEQLGAVLASQIEAMGGTEY